MCLFDPLGLLVIAASYSWYREERQVHLSSFCSLAIDMVCEKLISLGVQAPDRFPLP